MSAAAERNPSPWRRPAPVARFVARALYGWQDGRVSIGFGALAALPFVAAAALAPALLSPAPTAELLSPVAAARGVATGAYALSDVMRPFAAVLALMGEAFADTPGRIHLAGKAAAALLLGAAFASVAAVRLPLAFVMAGAAALAAVIVAPAAGADDVAVAALAVILTTLLAPPPAIGRRRAQGEGMMSGVLLFGLWLAGPLFWLCACAALCATPFVAGRLSLLRHVATLIVFAAAIGAAELAAPGLFSARALTVSDFVRKAQMFSATASLSWSANAAAIVIVMTLIFGGVEQARGWLIAAGVGAVGVVVETLGGVGAGPIFILAAALAAASTVSPFYDGIFRDHDRGSIAAATAAAALTLSASLASVAGSAAGLAEQARVAQTTDPEVRAALGLAAPPGSAFAEWIAARGGDTATADAAPALTAADQARVFALAFHAARQITARDGNVAILTAPDAACALRLTRVCRKDGLAAVTAADIVYSPRWRLDPATMAARQKSEAMLYTEFTRVEETPFWDVWRRRDAKSAEVTLAASAR